MPRALSIETSGRVGSVALSDNGTVLADDSFGHGLQHAATLLPRIDALCQRLGWTPPSIEHIYVSVGPGSFTGLRVGVTLAKTLAFTTGAKLVPVPSLRVLAMNAPLEATTVIPVLDAKRGQIFTARYTRPPQGLAASAAMSGSEWTEAEPPQLTTLAAILSRAARPVHLIGEGIPYHQTAIPADPGIIVTPEPLWQPRATSVAALGTMMAAAGQFADPMTLVPLYVRLPEAEEKRLAAEAAGR